MLVMKFGGSSLASGEALVRVAGLVDKQVSRRPVVVVSAIGRTTDDLVASAKLAREGRLQEARRRVSMIRQALCEAVGSVLADKLRLERELDRLVDDVERLLIALSTAESQECAAATDAILSHGEQFSSLVMTWLLQQSGLDAVHVDACEVLVTDERFMQAAPLYGPTNERLSDVVTPLSAAERIAVLGGFIGRTRDGRPSTLGRGGSDLSASVVGAGIGADEIQIWTDVDGIMTADPAMVSDAKRLPLLSFTEASELAYFGGRVLHPSTVWPAVDRNIPVRVLNSRKSDGQGTLIVADCQPSPLTVKSIVYKEGITVIDIRSSRMLMSHGFLSAIFSAFERLEIVVDVVSTSEVSVSLTIDRHDRLDELLNELREIAEVSHTDGQAIVCLVGDAIRHTPGVAATAFAALGEINVRMVSQGSSRTNLSLVIDERDVAAAVIALHHAFFDDVGLTAFA